MAGITQKSFETLFPLWSVVGYIDLEQNETYEKLKNRGWYSKWYWYFNNATTSNDNKNDDNTPASTVTATVKLLMKVIIVIIIIITKY